MNAIGSAPPAATAGESAAVPGESLPNDICAIFAQLLASSTSTGPAPSPLPTLPKAEGAPAIAPTLEGERAIAVAPTPEEERAIAVAPTPEEERAIADLLAGLGITLPSPPIPPQPATPAGETQFPAAASTVATAPHESAEIAALLLRAVTLARKIEPAAPPAEEKFSVDAGDAGTAPALQERTMLAVPRKADQNNLAAPASPVLPAPQLRVLPAPPPQTEAPQVAVEHHEDSGLNEISANESSRHIILPHAILSSETHVPVPKHVSNTAATEQVFAAVLQLADETARVHTDGRGQAELKLHLDSGEEVTIHLRVRDGEVAPVFKTDSNDLQAAIEQEWPRFADRSSERGLRFTSPAFEQSLGSDLPERESRRGFAQQNAPEEERALLPGILRSIRSQANKATTLLDRPLETWA